MWTIPFGFITDSVLALSLFTILKKHILRPVCVPSKYSCGVANTVNGRVLSTVKVRVGEPGEERVAPHLLPRDFGNTALPCI